MNKPGSRIAVISVIKFWSSSPPSWYSRSSVLCGGKNKLLTRVSTFRKFPWNKEFCLEMYWKCWLSAILVLQIRHFRWLQFASLDARSRFIHICGLALAARLLHHVFSLRKWVLSLGCADSPSHKQQWLESLICKLLIGWSFCPAWMKPMTAILETEWPPQIYSGVIDVVKRVLTVSGYQWEYYTNNEC